MSENGQDVTAIALGIQATLIGLFIPLFGLVLSERGGDSFAAVSLLAVLAGTVTVVLAVVR